MIVALAPRMTTSKFIRFALGAGIKEVLSGSDPTAVWTKAMNNAQQGPYGWLVTFSLVGLKDHLRQVRSEFSPPGIPLSNTKVMRALIAVGCNDGQILYAGRKA